MIRIIISNLDKIEFPFRNRGTVEMKNILNNTISILYFIHFQSLFKNKKMSSFFEESD